MKYLFCTICHLPSEIIVLEIFFYTFLSIFWATSYDSDFYNTKTKKTKQKLLLLAALVTYREQVLVI